MSEQGFFATRYSRRGPHACDPFEPHRLDGESGKFLYGWCERKNEPLDDSSKCWQKEGMPILRILAKNIAALRRYRNLSLVQLARSSGVPKSTISNIESGSANPSIETIYKLAQALSVSLEELISKPAIRQQTLAPAEMPVAREVRGSGKLIRVLPDPYPGVDLYHLILDGGAPFKFDLQVNSGPRLFYCTEGSASLRLGGEEFRIEKGGSILFTPDAPHSFRSDNSSKSEGLIVISYPSARSFESQV